MDGQVSASASAPVLESAEAQRRLADTVRVWLGLPASVEALALPDELVRLLLRLEEYETERRDPWGRWEFDQSENHRTGRLWIPEIDRWVAERRSELAGVPLEPLWPDGRAFAVCLTHDVDLVSLRSTPRQVLRHARAGLDESGGLLRFARPPVRLARSLRSGVARVPSTRDTLERSVAVEAARGAVASYLFTVPVGTDGSRYDCVYAPQDACRFRDARRSIADVMRTLAVEGFDVGLHGSYHSAVRPGALAAERALLQEATGLTISSTRQHLLHWDVRRTPRLQDEAGFLVDSSLGFNLNVGFRAGTSLPFRHLDVERSRPLGLLQVPLVVHDVALLGPLGLALAVEEARDVVDRFLDTAATCGGALTLSFHPDKLAHPDWLGLYEWALDRAAERGAWLTSLAGLERWWSAREARVLAG
jgi:hypothetical protein